MSVFFSNINVRSNDQRAVAEAFKRLPRRESAFIAPPVNGWVTVFDQVSDEGTDEDRLSGYTVMLSEKLKTQAIGFLVYESDVLLYTLASNGKILDQYSSWPDYFEENLPESEAVRWRGRPDALAHITSEKVPPQKVRAVLDAEHDFAEEKLAEMVGLLGLPEHAARWGYTYLAEDHGPNDRPAGWPAFLRLQPAFGMLG